MTAQFPLINGVRHSWSSVGFRAAGRRWGGITEVNYSVKLDSQYAMAAGSVPVGTTTGMGSMAADFSMLLSEANDLISSLGDSWMAVKIPAIQVSYSDEGFSGAGIIPTTDEILYANITEFSAAQKSGSGDALVRKFTLLPLRMLINGKDPLPPQPGADLGAVGLATDVIRRVFGI